MYIKIKRTDDLKVQVCSSELAGGLEKQSVEVNILLAILDKLEEIRCGIIDVEQEIKL